MIALLVALLTLLASSAAAQDFSVSTVPADQWGVADAEVGLAGAVVEDFEDTSLAPGLTLELADPSGAFTGPVLASLPAVFDPVDGDPYGDAFVDAAWDGTRVLLNIPGNVAVPYGSTDYRAVRINVPGGATKLAVAMHQVTGNHDLVVNGVSLGRLSTLGVPVVAGRNGLVIVTADDPAVPIVSVAFGGRGDAFCIDHVAFVAPAPVAVEVSTWGSVKALYRR